MASAVKLRAQADEHLRRSRLDKALAAASKAVEIAPLDPDVWVLLGTIYERLDQRVEAVDALFRAADLYARGGLPREGFELAGRVLAIDARHQGAQRLRSLMGARLGLGPAPPPPLATPPPVAMAKVSEGSAVPHSVDDDVSKPADLEAALRKVAERAPRRPPPPPGPRVATSQSAQPPPTSDAPAELPLAIENEPPLESLSLASHLATSAVGDSGVIEVSLPDPPRLHDPVASILQDSPLGAELDQELVKQLVDRAHLVTKKANEVLFRQGDYGDALYIILRGEVSVVRERPERVELARLRAGAFFGEMALLTNLPRSATINVAQEADLLLVTRQGVRDLIQSDGRVLTLLLRFFRARLVGTLLATSSLFRPFSRDERRRIVSGFRLRELPAGQLVIREGERADGLYVVLAGRLSVSHAAPGQPERPIGALAVGDVFGEMSLLLGTVAVATIRTVTKTWALVLPSEDFRSLVESHPHVRTKLAELAEERRRRNEAAGRDEPTNERRLENL